MRHWCLNHPGIVLTVGLTFAAVVGAAILFPLFMKARSGGGPSPRARARVLLQKMKAEGHLNPVSR